MRKLSIQHLQPGTKLAKAVYSGRGALIMPANIGLEANQIERLKAAGVTEVLIEDPRVADIEIVEPIPEVTKIKALRILKHVFQEVQNLNKFKKVPELSGAYEIVNEIIEEVGRNKQKVVNLFACKPSEDYLHVQALNVTILTIAMAKLAGFTANLKDIALGAFLKDIGLAQIAPEIINKPAELTREELELIRQHAVSGLEILGALPATSAFTKVIINQHHERCDGSGYPRGLKDSQIHMFAKLVAIADSYAAAISWRPYRRQLNPHEAIEMIMSSAGFELDHTLVDYFTKCTVPYPIGTMVELSSGEKGIIVSLGKSLATRPIIRVFYDASGQQVNPCYEINLMDERHQTKLIIGVLDD